MERAAIGFLVALSFALSFGTAKAQLRPAAEFRATFGQPPPSVSTLQAAGSGKVTLIDHSDFYIHRSGRRVSFLRKEATYVVLPGPGAASAAPNSASLKAQLGADADLTKERPLGRRAVFRIKEGRDAAVVLDRVRALDPSAFISPVLATAEGVGDLGVSTSVIVRLASAVDPASTLNSLEQTFNLSVTSALRSAPLEFELEMLNQVEDVGEIFELAVALGALSGVEWAEPNFVVAPRRLFTPNDPQYADQWHLNNSGQNGAAVDADIDAPEGWDVSQGSGMVIAVFDDGVDLGHEDLAIWSNPGETGGGKETNGVDDDLNGYIDDYQGWDFRDNDNDPSPGAGDNHGTAVAGVAGAIGDNGVGVAGSALGASILPIRWGMTCTEFGDAMRYAGKYGHVVNNSWGISACESELDSAVSDVVNGSVPGAVRGALGTPVLFATGNAASGWQKFTLSGFPAGSFDFEWRFDKDVSVDQGYDTVWLDDITWPGGAVDDFEGDTPGTIPAGFTSGGSADWTAVSDGVHARGASGNSAKAGVINNNQQTSLYALSKTVGSGDLTFWVWVSSEYNYDFFELYVNGTMYLQFAPGQYGEHTNAVGYPASNSDTIAVGASGDGGLGNVEERSAYSQFGPEVDVVAPSGGGGQGITTTDRTGPDGYGTGNYTDSFSGTSSAAPLVAGIVADILAHDPSLSATQLRQRLRAGADEIGPYAYPGDRNDHYGDGRVNLVGSMPVCGDGVLDAGEACDDGNTSPGDCCSATCQFESLGTECRAAADVCDLAEVCDGVTAVCPGDDFEPATTECRTAVGVCDAVDSCDGVSAACPVDLKLTSECRAAADVCDIAESCDGIADACPGDDFEPATTECRAAVGVCDAVDSCDGVSAACPVDLKLTSECRAAADVCDIAESCDGIADACPGDGFEPATTECRAAVGVCDAVDSCDGVSAACPVDLKLTSECRAAADVCDIAESCDGIADACPGDGFEPATTECRTAVGVCDAVDSCDGVSAACPVDVKLTSECRAAADVCDIAESCDGVADACPGDDFEPATTECRTAAGVCDAVDSCDGVSAACSVDVKLTSECRAAADVCDIAESCDGIADACPGDGFEPATTECRTAVGVCDAVDSCDGVSAACSVDVKLTSECRAAADVCDIAESCDGVADACPGDDFEPATTECRTAAGVCDAVDSCDGVSAACSVDVKLTSECRAAADVCDIAESCDGVADACPGDGFEPATTECRTAAGVCDAVDSCDGVSAACSVDVKLTSECRAAADVCDIAELCDGITDACPGDGFEPATTECRTAAGICDAVDSCDGVSAACSVDVKLTSECRAAADVCDIAESCDGVADACPGDSFEPATTECRTAAGVCDAVDSCDGVSAACSVDLKLTSECRAAADVCDIAESCDGVADACPGDSFEPATTECRTAAGVCDAVDSCDGVSAACSVDVKLTSECRAAADVCDIAESCDGVADACPGDGFEPATTECRTAAGICDAVDSCDGVSAACSVDVKLTSECRAAADVCDIAESCDGITDACPGDGFEPATTECRTAAGICDAVDSCDGVSAACSVDVKLTSECRAAADVCDIAESCDGVADACPGDDFEPATTECRTAAGICDAVDSCDGVSAACSVDVKLTSECRAAADVCDIAESCDGVADACPGDGFEPDGNLCNDADVCTAPDQCLAGVCEGVPLAVPGCEEPEDVPLLSHRSQLLLLAILLVLGVWMTARSRRTA